MDRVKFKINNVEHSVGSEVSSDMMLVDYLRNKAELRGTKYMCREGGCGACCVAVIKSPGARLVAVNSCLVAITSCHGWEITTIEGLGNRKIGYHVLQKTLAESYGTQCGHCTPSWIMNMHSLTADGYKPTMMEVETAFGNNVCRCTGYRPIMEAFKKFCIDAPIESRISDIEDLPICKKTNLPCDKSKCDDDGGDWCVFSDQEVNETTTLQIELQDNKYWYKVYDLKSIIDILETRGTDSYMIVFGNTAKGIYPIDSYANTLIDVTSVSEMQTTTIDQNLTVGVGISLIDFQNILESNSKQEYFGYFAKLVKHIKAVATNPVKNLGSLAGNLMIKHDHNSFQSDLFLLLETVGAYLELYTLERKTVKVSMEEFLKLDMVGKIIVNVILPPLTDNYKLETYKIMPRAQSAPALVNAGFLIDLASDNTVTSARIVYGGLSANFIRAGATEQYLVGKPLFVNSTLQSALTILESELVIDDRSGSPSVEFRKQLCLSLFYKCMITLCPKGILNSRFVSGTTRIHETRPVSKSKQDYTTDSSLYPLNQPIHKTEALIQCAGETKYTEDLQAQPREVFGAFALSTQPSGNIDKIDSSAALKMPGVIAVYTAADIPGVNSFIPNGAPLFVADEEVLVSKKVSYYNQPIAIVVAKTQAIAVRAAKLVTATYSDVKVPVIDIKIAKNDPNRIQQYSSKKSSAPNGTDVAMTIKGQNTMRAQIHMPMENMSCVTTQTEEGLECHVTTQWIDGCQLQTSKALNIPSSKIDVCTRRLGGAFGLKVSRPNCVTVASALVAMKCNVPCRFIIPFNTCIKAFGKRMPCHADFELTVSATGEIQSMDYSAYEDNGYIISEVLTLFGADVFNNCYDDTKWTINLYDVITDTAKNTFCRSPGSLEGIALAEFVVERISYELSLDPVDVRLANLSIKYKDDLKKMAENLSIYASYIERKAKVAKFNSENRWKKRGLRWSFVRWTPVAYSILDINITICHGDGTVIITHGGIEMGQGINTIAVQVCAYKLGIPVDMIQIKGNNTIITPNCFATGASLGSQNVGFGVGKCCDKIMETLTPIKTRLGNPTWLELVLEAYASNVDLQFHCHVGTDDVFNFDIFGVALAEVELDVLTGETEKLRVDICQDVGRSVNPAVDMGQVEGAFIMGQGYWTCEEVVYDNATGEVLSDGTLSYHVPLARDIPQDFRVAFRPNSYSLDPIMGAKCTGEPPICLSVVIPFAIREAIAAARQECGIPTTTWFEIDGAYTVEKILLASSLRKEDFTYT